MKCAWLPRFWEYQGYFVEVGGNDPCERSQTGILIEPQPDLVAKLRARRKAKVFEVACSSLKNADARAAAPERVINVPIRTLDSILAVAY